MHKDTPKINLKLPEIQTNHVVAQ